jgi:hypothetical protein
MGEMPSKHKTCLHRHVCERANGCFPSEEAIAADPLRVFIPRGAIATSARKNAKY